VSKVAIVNLPFPPIGSNAGQDNLLQATVEHVLGRESFFEHDVVVAMFPDGQHRMVRDRTASTQLTVINR
jgi:hypothetical protein